MIRALIFDLDGVITDTEPVHMEAWLDVLEPLGLSFGEEEYRAHYLGLNDRDFLGALGRIHGHHFSETDKANFTEQKSLATLESLGREIPLLPGVQGFVEDAAKHHLLAICSGATRGEIEFILRRLRWDSWFSPVIASDSVRRGKPDPEGYIRAFEGLAERSSHPLFPGEVIAIEDSPKGIQAAKAAGLCCLAVGSGYSPEELAKADWIAASLAEVDLQQVGLRA